MKHLLIALSMTFAVTANAGLDDLLEGKDLKTTVRDFIATQDISFGQKIGDIDLIEGVNLSSRYSYTVEPSYDKLFARIDKWDVKGNINVGDIVKEFVELPFSFSVNRKRSFYFVRQYKQQAKALIALPYTPFKLPLTAKAALKGLNPGDFVSMPANLSVGVGVGLSTGAVATGTVVNAGASVSLIVSGEFTIQVFKVDETHARVKVISSRSAGASAGLNADVSFKLFGIKLVDKQIKRFFDNDLASIGISIAPGSQFIADYIFDLSNPEAQVAYNQILSSTLKFKDITNLNKITDGEDLKDKMISSYEKAEKLFAADSKLEYSKRRVSRIFKGFTSYKATGKHLKLGVLITSLQKDKTFTDNKITYTDKDEKNLEFLYPTVSQYLETQFGKKLLKLKDQTNLSSFGLIPRFGKEDTHKRAPDFGLSFERRDTHFTKSEQAYVKKYVIGQIPEELVPMVDLSAWQGDERKLNSRVNFRLIFKAQGFPYLKAIPREEFIQKMIAYSVKKQILHGDESSESPWEKLKDLLFVNRTIQKEMVKNLAIELYDILQNKEDSSEIMTKKLVTLNQKGIFSKIGIGYLASLLPRNKIKELVFVSLELIAKDTPTVTFEYGTLNYKALYDELAEVQSRINFRSYDMRVTDIDREKLELDTDDRDDLDKLDVNFTLE